MSPIYTGRVQDGVVVFEEDTPPLAEGTKVRIEPVATATEVGEPRTLGDLFAGRLGRIHSGGRERLSEECGAKFAEHLHQSHRSGEVPRP
jgi:hypothetical protein